MLLLLVYVFIALGFSFLCSIAEAVILSVTSAHVALLVQQGKASGRLLSRLKENINKPLAAILTLNTIAHTAGAAGAGAQAAKVFGDTSLGMVSAVLTLLILIFSEIIPKTIGAHYWRNLAPVTAYGLNGLIYLLYPFVKLSEILTNALSGEPVYQGLSRREFAAMAEISAEEGQLGPKESTIVQNLMLLRETKVEDVMTPRPVVFTLDQTLSVEDFFLLHGHTRFSRIPIYGRDRDEITGFVLRSDLLLAQARGDSDKPLRTYCREIKAVIGSASLTRVFDEMLHIRAHIMLVVDSHGGMNGVVTLEDVLETLLGLEIVDEQDKTVDMRKLARQIWRRRAREMGLEVDD